MPRKAQKVIAIVGPTAVGKSAIAVRLARRFNGEVISADSRQVYTGLNIGTGKITKREMHGVPHHLIDVANPKSQFTVADFQRLGREKIEAIFARGCVPIVCGGTGLYVDALLKGTSIPEVLPRQKLRRQLEKKTPEMLFAMLQELDPRRAKTVDRNNPRRLIRAIEIAKALGQVPNQQPTTNQQQKVCWLGITLPREELHKKIAIRLFARISEQGMIAEAERLHRKGLSWKRMEELGLEYRYLAQFLQGKVTREEMVRKLQKESCCYAKRQMTWFKRNKEIQWFTPKQFGRLETVAKRFLRR